LRCNDTVDEGGDAGRQILAKVEQVFLGEMSPAGTA
jgi:hypothetical protein